jgi:hypothetical protein
MMILLNGAVLILVHQAPAADPGVSKCCADFALLAITLHVVPQMY